LTLRRQKPFFDESLRMNLKRDRLAGASNRVLAGRMLVASRRTPTNTIEYIDNLNFLKAKA
jgi:hypothetical protein